MLSTTSLWLALLAGPAVAPAQDPPPKKVKSRVRPCPVRVLYDSLSVTFLPPVGMYHREYMQSSTTYERIGHRQPLDECDSVFLRKWMPDYMPVLRAQTPQARRATQPVLAEQSRRQQPAPADPLAPIAPAVPVEPPAVTPPAAEPAAIDTPAASPTPEN